MIEPNEKIKPFMQYDIIDETEETERKILIKEIKNNINYISTAALKDLQELIIHGARTNNEYFIFIKNYKNVRITDTEEQTYFNILKTIFLERKGKQWKPE